MKRPQRDHMRCSRCSGTGRVDLPPELQATLTLLRQRGAMTPTQLHETMDFGGVTAANNRLETLRKLGFATRERIDGKRWKYSAVKPGSVGGAA